MDSAKKVIEYFTKFPGIGQRQARRFVFFLLDKDQDFLNNLAEAIKTLKAEISRCKSCFRFFEEKGDICDICRNTNTDGSTLMVVEKDIDFENIKKSGAYDGRYFILGGTLPILEKNPTESIRIRELVGEIGNQLKTGLKEVIIALSVNPEGDNTANYVKKTLEPISAKHGLKISTLGRGLSTGTELEYSDQDTLRSAFKNRA